MHVAVRCLSSTLGRSPWVLGHCVTGWRRKDGRSGGGLVGCWNLQCLLSWPHLKGTDDLAVWRVRLFVCMPERERFKKKKKKKEDRARVPVVGIFMRAALYPVCVGYFTNGVVGRELGRNFPCPERVKEKESGFDWVPAEVPSDVA